MKRTLTLICLLELGLAAFAASGPRTTFAIDSEAHRAIRSGSVASLKQALDRGLLPNAADAAGNTVLMQSAAYGDLACLDLLIKEGADVNATNRAGATALMRAAYDYDKVRFLVQHGARVNAHSAFGNTALMMAARTCNSHRTVAFLIGSGAEVNATNNWGATALICGVAGGDEDTIRILLKNRANPNAQLAPAKEAFIFAGGRTALMWAAFRGDVKALKLLVDAGADVNAEGILGTALTQAAWGNHPAAARFLIEHGADVNAVGHPDGYTPLHWAASSEDHSDKLTRLLLSHGADPNRGGGENVDAFMDIPQTPLMLARRRGQTPILSALLKAGATNETPDRVRTTKAAHPLAIANEQMAREAISRAVPLLEETSIRSKESFVNHASKQDCVSCHQQFLPLAAIGAARNTGAAIDEDSARHLAAMISLGEFKTPEPDWEALFHPDAAQTKGYDLFGEATAGLPANEHTDAAVHHLSAIQGPDGRWHNNLPRPPIQTSDIGATALTIHALQAYPLPGRKAQFAKQVERAKAWLGKAKSENTDERIYQLLGLGWAGESPEKLQGLARVLAAEEKSDGGWSQLPGLNSDAYATAQAVYALKIAAALPDSDPSVARGKDWLVRNQLEDGSWYVHRRAFPFQPTTIHSGFPHGKDSWISAAATSWAILALTAPDSETVVASAK